MIDAETPEQARDATDRLVHVLSADRENFDDVYLPGGGSFFEEHALLYQSVDNLDEFAEHLIRLQPIVGELEQDGSIGNLASLIQRGLDNLELDGRDDALWSDILDRVSRASVEIYRENPVAVSWEELMLRGSAIEVAKRRVVVAHPVLDFGAALPARAPLAAVRAASAALGLEADAGVRLRITGNPALTYDETIALVFDIGVSGAFCLVLVAGVLWIALRARALVAGVVTTLLVGLVWTAGFAALAVGDLNVISVAAGVLFLGLGVDFGIHFSMRHAELLRLGVAHGEALDETTRSVGGSLVVCTVTTAIGFFAFLPTDYRGVAELGLITGVGLIIILFLTLTLLPALLTTVFRVDPARLGEHRLRFGEAPARFVQRNALSIRWVSLAAALAGLALLASLRFDANIVAMRDPSTESVQTFNDLLSDAGNASPWYANSVVSDLDEADRLKLQMRELDVVERSITLSDYVPDDQEEKLEILADLAMMMEGGGRGPETSGAGLPVSEQIDALRRLQKLLDENAGDARSPLLRASMLDLASKLSDFLTRADRNREPEEALAQLETVLLSSLPAQIARLHAALAASAVEVATLPPRLVRRLQSPDGRARVQTFPRENLDRHEALLGFVDALQRVDPNATGVAVNLVEFARTTQEAFRQALVTALLVIAAILWIRWRRLDEMLLVLAPLFLAAILTGAAMVLIDLPLNFFNVVVIPLLLGAGVDSGIHLVEQSRVGYAKSERSISEDDGAEFALLGSTTARAVFFSALTTITSFGTLAFSSHVGLSGLGTLLTLGMALSVVCNLAVLPALLAWVRQSPPLK